MGLVLDSSALIGAEREARPVSQLLRSIERDFGETEIFISSISMIELEHGLYRAVTAEQIQRRKDYLGAVFAAIPVQPFTHPMGQLAAKIDADAKNTGSVIPFIDLLIGVTALHFSYGIATRNVRHFQRIPDLKVLPF
jgi:predicted nucleic acid-binding protein